MGLEISHIKKGQPESAGLHAVLDFAESVGCRCVREDIVGGTSLRLISTPLGIFGVAICKDLLWTERSTLRRYADLADHLLIVSMNAAPARFWPEAVKLCDLGTGVFFVNTPQLVPESYRSMTEIAFCHVPAMKSFSPATRYCAYLKKPVETPFQGVHTALPPGGRVVFQLNLQDERFINLLTES
jgi:hypothetical protein